MPPGIECSLNKDQSKVLIQWHDLTDQYKLVDRFENIFSIRPSKNTQSIAVPIGYFLLHLGSIRRYWSINFGPLKDFIISDELIKIYKSIPTLQEVTDKNICMDESLIQAKLVDLGWNQNWILTKTQLRNVSKIVNLPAAADFSVPGAGKTTEALAIHLLKKKHPADRCLIISPKSAFEAWEIDIPNCLSNNNSIIQLDGDLENVKKKLNKNADFYIINYEKLRHISPDEVPHYCRVITAEISKPEHNYSIICDEAHRMRGEVTASIMQLLAPLTQNKLILTGTPCPQHLDNLIPQFRFLYPKETFGGSEDIADKFQKIYVRTSKIDLLDQLPPIQEELISIPYSGNLSDVYNAITQEIKETKFDHSSKQFLRQFSKVVIRLVRLCANPKLVLDDVYEMNFELGEKLATEGLGPKIKMVIANAAELIRKGHKVLIWSHFPSSIDDICAELETYNFNPVKIYGGIPMGDKIKGFDEPGTRRYAIDQFKNNPDCMALVANPMAAGEGISLHHVCRHALYADRSFSVAHYLQSKDRIHRIGGDISKKVNIKVYSLPGTIDERVYELLKIKTEIMAKFLDDDGINTNFIKYDIDFESEQKAFLSEDGMFIDQSDAGTNSYHLEDLESFHDFLIRN
ncbi:DEAD/DEAH box helicase [Gammaproteobacteria bacterium]|nr:DEAD/DEAH box helicase [Gammaproteobacteria bacterium]